ncbi:hypothetical protein ATE92_2720 [Ulvibacter sp. MAR_2010_11]|uniref:hypothetical protein n=1 Tax=Ulvibacter sp. MAR_2010_11 TaxID=1250229 RepID=UPI000C2C64A7|nr:hypothetical protein [Ulvibacter sp. MAR_2010_11]PKA84525.1 hypothetical protein ATE92_2720 [Ulvibacter sp. MAR_2010_11]
MKKITLLLIFSFVTATGFSQEFALTLFNFDSPEKPTRMLLLSTTTNGAQEYIVERMQDTHSQKLMAAASEGTVFKMARILIKDASGNIQQIGLNEVTLGNYSAVTDNGRAKEQFTVRFQSTTILE